MTNHIDQLTEWWENAEDAPARPGDRIIERHVCDSDDDTYYSIGVHREGMRGLIGKSGTRILSRAPKPEPAWHDAAAVVATYGHVEGFITRGPLMHVGDGAWRAVDGCLSNDDQLRDVTPLIEMPSHEELTKAILSGWEAASVAHVEDYRTWCVRGNNAYKADAVLELLRGRA